MPELGTRKAWIEWLKTIPDDRRQAIMRSLETDDDTAMSDLMTPDQVRQLAENGHEIGSHTLSHPILPTMTADQRRKEIVGARQLLREWTNREVPGFCYPNGDFDAEVIGDLRRAGHSYACTTLPGRNDRDTDPFRLRRIDVTTDRVTSTDGRFDLLGFRAEISLFREGLRQMGRLRGRTAER
jgi:peptidoglycan/xylan/chitin deacetylase (PgdA/CDA1 family)